MRAFIIVALVAAASGEADPYTIGQVLAGQTNGGVITSTTYHGGLKVPGFAGLYAGVPQVAATIPKTVVAAHTPVVSAVHGYGLPYAGYGGVVYGKREAEAEPWTVAQVALGAHVANAAAEGRAPGVITNAAIAPATHVVAGYAAPYAYAGYPYAHAGVYYGKREAEADPAVVAVSPYALHHGVYSTGLIGGVAGSNPVHAVAATPFGLTHSSNVGICTNYVGAQVPCRRKREADAQYLPYAGVYSGVYPTVYAGVHGTNPVHAVAHTAAGLTHSSNVGICTNYLGAVVPC